MKKIIIAAFTVIIGTAAFGQTTDTVNKKDVSTNSKAKTYANKQTAEKQDVKYCCPNCDFCDSKPGKCPVHNLDLIKTGDYYCTSCYTTSVNAAKCPKCGKDMEKMDCKNGPTNLKTPIGK